MYARCLFVAFLFCGLCCAVQSPGRLTDHVQKLRFAGGTTVTVLAPQELDKERLFLVAKQVKRTTKNRDEVN